MAELSSPILEGLCAFAIANMMEVEVYPPKDGSIKALVAGGTEKSKVEALARSYAADHPEDVTVVGWQEPTAMRQLGPFVVKVADMPWQFQLDIKE